MASKRICAFSIDGDLADIFKQKSKNMSADIEDYIRIIVNSDDKTILSDEEFEKLNDEVALLKKEFEEISFKRDLLDKKLKKAIAKQIEMKAKKLQETKEDLVERKKRHRAGLNTVHVINKMGMNDIFHPDNFKPSNRPFVERKNEFEREEQNL